MSVVEGRADIKHLLLGDCFDRDQSRRQPWGGGWSILWREGDADRAWFVRKLKMKIRKTHCVRVSALALAQSGRGRWSILWNCPVDGRADLEHSRVTSAFDPFRTSPV